MDAMGRQRLSNIIRYFARNTEACGKIKLFKLLYLLDFQHVGETGKPVIGLDYQAWKFGPVPVQVMESWDDPETEVAEGCTIVSQTVFDYPRQTIVADPGYDFDEDIFSRRELRIMRELAEKYRSSLSSAMIDVTHQQNGAWDKVWQDGRGAYQPIPFEMAIPDEDPHASVLREIHGDYQARNRAAKELARSGD